MRVLLVGATGKVGAPVLRELLDRGHEVTAMVRNPARLPAEKASLRHRAGDAFALEAADGCDVVVCSVALRDAAQHDRTPLALIRAVAGAAARGGARLVAMGGAGSLRTATGVDLVDTPAFPEVARRESLGFREALHDLVAAAPAGLDWTVVSPPVSIEVDGPRTGTYRTGVDELVVDAAGASRISAADLAVAVVDEVETPRHPCRRFSVGY